MKELSKMLEKARKYEEKAKVEQKKSQNPIFHMKVPTGWMNDPNGFSVYKGEYHLFFQYHPYSREWGPMHWGHVKTKDFVQWEHLPVAMAPDQPYDCEGCFSGSALEDHGKHIVAYTSVSYEDKMEKTDGVCQTQSIAIGDGVCYTKQESNPVIDKRLLPEGASKVDFRDPKIWKQGKQYYMIVANRDRDGRGQLLKYVSQNLEDWKYEGVFYKPVKELGRMWECPDYFELDGKKVLLVSPQDMQAEGLRYHCGNGTLYLLGREEAGHFCEKFTDNLDFGIDFYAPQTLLTTDGRRVMIAWMQSWDVDSYPADFNWRGMMTFPRELCLEQNKIRQLPVKEIERYWKNEVIYRNVSVNGTASLKGICGRVLDLTLYIKNINCNVVEIRLAKKEKKYISIEYDAVREILTFDRKYTQCIRDIVNERKVTLPMKSNAVSIRVLLDLYSAEIFLNEGDKVLTSLFFLQEDHDEIEFITYGGVCEMDIYKRDICRQPPGASY